jgi:hypothetical protein
MARIVRLVILSLVLAGVLLVTKGLTHPAQGQTGCSGASLSGPYGLQGSGMVYGVPAAFVGTFVFDGQGKSTGFLTLNLGGEIDPIGDITGTYKIDETCSGSAVLHTVHHSPPSDHYHDMRLVVVDGGKEALFETGGIKRSASDNASAGVVLSGAFKRL